VALLALIAVHTEKTVRELNEFNWFPILEVAKLFAGIFIDHGIPAIAILQAPVSVAPFGAAGTAAVSTA
jgi:hypothetical protein